LLDVFVSQGSPNYSLTVEKKYNIILLLEIA
jgi:hypothetical protein